MDLNDVLDSSCKSETQDSANAIGLSDIIDILSTLDHNQSDPNQMLAVRESSPKLKSPISLSSSGSISPVFLNNCAKPTTATIPASTESKQSTEKPFIRIVEQPANKALRFRYVCEGRSAGSIPGVNTTADYKTYPTIEIANYKGEVTIVVSCVTKDPPYRPHPHNLVGKEGCEHGVCTMRIKGDPPKAVFSNLGIQCVRKKDIKSALQVRESRKVDPFKTKFSHMDNPNSIDLNVVRLCFQAFIQTGPRQYKKLTPVVSDPIYDKKAMSDLVISRLCSCSAKVGGGDEIIMLCEKVPKDIKIKFYELNSDDDVSWEDYADFQLSDIHKQAAIVFRTPRYHNSEIKQKARVFIQLERSSDGATSESLPFEYHPDPGMHSYDKHIPEEETDLNSGNNQPAEIELSTGEPDSIKKANMCITSSQISEPLKVFKKTSDTIIDPDFLYHNQLVSKPNSHLRCNKVSSGHKGTVPDGQRDNNCDEIGSSCLKQSTSSSTLRSIDIDCIFNNMDKGSLNLEPNHTSPTFLAPQTSASNDVFATTLSTEPQLPPSSSSSNSLRTTQSTFPIVIMNTPNQETFAKPNRRTRSAKSKLHFLSKLFSRSKCNQNSKTILEGIESNSPQKVKSLQTDIKQLHSSSISGNPNIIHIPLKVPHDSSRRNHLLNNIIRCDADLLDRRTVNTLQKANISLIDGNLELIAIVDRQTIKGFCNDTTNVTLHPSVDLYNSEHFALYIGDPNGQSPSVHRTEQLLTSEEVMRRLLAVNDEIKRKRLKSAGKPMNILHRELQKYDQLNNFSDNSKPTNMWNLTAETISHLPPFPDITVEEKAYNFGPHRSPYQATPSPQQLSPANRNLTPSPLGAMPNYASPSNVNYMQMKDACNNNLLNEFNDLQELKISYNNNNNNNNNNNLNINFNYESQVQQNTFDNKGDFLTVPGNDNLMGLHTPNGSNSNGSIPFQWNVNQNVSKPSNTSDLYISSNNPDGSCYNNLHQNQLPMQVETTVQNQQLQQPHPQQSQQPFSQNINCLDADSLNSLLHIDSDQFLNLNSDDLKLSNLSIFT